ncbi:hypothetical protein AB6A40_002267 [Gnathostoma spinigerum]|uniref:LNS2/PITP domain-containing protein n=1 Tax=Gnathostoma spinigerum TaxID=75299 RepID=A0ABD6E6A6_9BILA
MDFAYRFFENVRSLYTTMNPATLSGAIDSIVVEQPDGSYKSTPFHVRFGKYGVFSSNEKYVDITVNGQEIDLKMKLGENGIAFFVEPCEPTDVCEHLSTSPIPGSSPDDHGQYMANNQFGGSTGTLPSNSITSENNVDFRTQGSHIQSIANQSDADFSAQRKKSLPFCSSLFSQRTFRSLPDLLELGRSETNEGQGSSPKEVDSSAKRTGKHSRSSSVNRSSLPAKNSRRKRLPVSRLRKEKVTEEKKESSPVVHVFSSESDSDDVTSSCSSIPSNCNYGALSDSEVDSHRNAPEHGSDVTDWKWGELPKVCDGSFQTHVEQDSVQKEKEKKKTESSWSDWIPWYRPKPSDDHGIYLDDLVENSRNDPTKMDKYFGQSSSSCPSPPFDSGNSSSASVMTIPNSPPSSFAVENDTFQVERTQNDSSTTIGSKTPAAGRNLRFTDGAECETPRSESILLPSQPIEVPEQRGSRMIDRIGSQPIEDSHMSAGGSPTSTSYQELSQLHEKTKHYKMTLYLTSDKLRSLGLHFGANEALFSITTRIQGTCRCSCRIYLYKWYDRIVISDIDGTITKSDVLGHVIPAIGGQWAHAGVAELYTRINDNGYKFVYLSSRAIGQSYSTKKYLQSIAQNSRVLPDGPLILNPTSVLTAIRRELIDRNPQEFKIKALTSLKSCFPVEQPFYAGFGNRKTDFYSYHAVDIPLDRILIINSSGTVQRADSIGFKTSYLSMANESVDFFFPPLTHHETPVTSDEESSRYGSSFIEPKEFSDFTFWRTSATDCISLLQKDVVQSEHPKRNG